MIVGKPGPCAAAAATGLKPVNYVISSTPIRFVIMTRLEQYVNDVDEVVEAVEVVDVSGVKPG